jgi:hypothetical protein
MIPSIPKKTYFNRFNDNIIEERRKEFQKFLNFCITNEEVSNSKRFQDFFNEK